MAPIRVGFLGLSKSGWAVKAHLPYIKATDKYEIVAVCNSSVKSAKEAIKTHSLPESTKAYGDPNDLANDENVELVVCSVRVDRHLPTIGPSLKAGKDVYVEWPLGKSLKEAQELLRLRDEGKVKRAMVGLQARQEPVIRKLKELVDGGRIGKVLSSHWVAQAMNFGPETSEGAEYMGRKEVGGNMLTIHFGHSIDYIQHVLGYGFSSSHSVMANRRPLIKLLDDQGKVVSEKHAKTSDDTIFLHGVLSTSGIPVSINMRGGLAFKDTPGLDWRIYGETGEIRVTGSGPFLNIGFSDTKITLHDFAQGEVETIDVGAGKGDEPFIMGLPVPAKNVGRVYEMFAKGENNCTFEDAIERHKFLDAMYKQNGYEG